MRKGLKQNGRFGLLPAGCYCQRALLYGKSPTAHINNYTRQISGLHFFYMKHPSPHIYFSQSRGENHSELKILHHIFTYLFILPLNLILAYRPEYSLGCWFMVLSRFLQVLLTFMQHLELF